MGAACHAASGRLRHSAYVPKSIPLELNFVWQRPNTVYRLFFEQNRANRDFGKPNACLLANVAPRMRGTCQNQEWRRFKRMRLDQNGKVAKKLRILTVILIAYSVATV